MKAIIRRVSVMAEESREIKMARFVEASGITTSPLRHREENGRAQSHSETSVKLEARAQGRCKSKNPSKKKLRKLVIYSELVVLLCSR